MQGTDAGPGPVTFVTCRSVLDFDLGHPTAQRAVLDPQFLHRLVMSGFYGWLARGTAEPRSRLRVLHAATADLAQDDLRVLVQARVRPDWERVSRRALRCRPAVTTIDERIARGQQYDFRTIVHPTRDSGQGRRRRELADPKDALAWFVDRLQPEGEPATSSDGRNVRRIGADARTQDLEVTVLPSVQDIRQHPGRRVTRSEIRGRLTVTDPAALVEVLQCGLGRSKALGCGLLVLEPVPLVPG